MTYVKSNNTPSIHENLPKRLDWIEDGIANAGSGSGTVTSVTAADTSIVVAGTATDPTIKTATLDVIAADNPPAADWSNNSHKITNLANGVAANDAAAFGQIPTSLKGNGDESLFTIAASGTAQALDLANGATQDITLTGNCTLTFTSPASGSAWYMTLLLRQDATGSRTVAWPAITWLGSGIAPTLQTAASSVDSVVVFTVNGGSTWYGVAQTSASGLRSGTSFPGSPSDGDLFYRTDRRILYEYDATSTNWLTLDRKYVPFGPGDALQNTTSSGVKLGFLPVFEDVYVEKFVATTFVSTTNNGSNYWTVSLSKWSTGNVITTVGSVATNADAATTPVEHSLSVGSVFQSASIASLFYSQSSTGAPGAIRCPAMLICRAVG